VIEGQKYPHHIFSERNEVFAFAGIWTNGHETESGSSFFSLLTRSAASDIFHIHHRVPLVLTEEHWKNWLKQDVSEQALIAQTQCQQPKWSATQVSSRVNSTRNNDSSLLEPYSGKQSLLF
jgi:putative SOS response-associated peptidase YedK